ncbi:hypothetical protein F503_05781 [Ophiostoma piceae UAMH 11346]|uniref:Altered inheritance of mitochondria protein 41 n=1 Tax=Ophiostoma piceae (strain UAMH 11346) TaxID=1262450 RepID=S3CF23_OPHP1|nr:hypothetical protein F503_05781 [Ophiostoma piceae UAMH 11346]
MAARPSIVRLAASRSSLLASYTPTRGPVSAACRRTAIARSSRCYSTSEDAPPPPLLVKLKGDLKAAMKAKDAPRLSVLRSVLAATLNASKTAQPIDTDVKLVELLRKSARSAQDAVEEFKSAGRSDLAEKEEAQIRVLEAYAQDSGIESLSKEDLEVVVAKVLEELTAETGAKPRPGDAIKRLLTPGGPLDGKDFNKAVMAQVVKQLTSK